MLCPISHLCRRQSFLSGSSVSNHHASDYITAELCYSPQFIYCSSGSKPFNQFPIAGYHCMKLRAYPCPPLPFGLLPPFYPPSCRWTFIVVLSSITSLNVILSSFWRLNRIFAHNPRLLPAKTGHISHANTRIQKVNPARDSRFSGYRVSRKMLGSGIR
jgi:hypothetical protein